MRLCDSDYKIKLFNSIRDGSFISEFLPLTEDSRFEPNLRNEHSPYKQDLLSFAVFFQQKEIASYLIKKGANLNNKDHIYEKTPLHWAASNQDVEIIQKLIDNGADVNQQNKFGYSFWNILNNSGKKQLIKEYSPVFVAVQSGDLNKLKEELHKNPGRINAIDVDFNSPLHAAAEKGNVNICIYLIEKGADLSKMNKNGFNAYEIAEQKGKEEILELMKAKDPAFVKDMLQYKSYSQALSVEGESLEVKVEKTEIIKQSIFQKYLQELGKMMHYTDSNSSATSKNKDEHIFSAPNEIEDEKAKLLEKVTEIKDSLENISEKSQVQKTENTAKVQKKSI